MNDKIKAVLMLDQVSLNFQVELTHDEAMEYAKNIRPYNDCTTENMTGLLARIEQHTPKIDYGPNHPSTGRPLHSCLVGNESSRVMYLQMRKYRMPTDFDYASFAIDLRGFAALYMADEADVWVDDEHEFVFRFWWD